MFRPVSFLRARSAEVEIIFHGKLRANDPLIDTFELFENIGEYIPIAPKNLRILDNATLSPTQSDIKNKITIYQSYLSSSQMIGVDH